MMCALLHLIITSKHGVHLFNLQHEGVQCRHSLLAEVEIYQKKCKMDQAEWCYFLEHQHESMHTAYDILMTLKVIFDDQNHNNRQDRINVFLNTKMTKRTPVRISF